MKKFILTFCLLFIFIFVFTIPLNIDADEPDDFVLNDLYVFNEEIDFTLMTSIHKLTIAYTVSADFFNNFFYNPNSQLFSDDINFYSVERIIFECSYSGPSTVYSCQIYFDVIGIYEGESISLHLSVYNNRLGWVNDNFRYLIFDHVSTSEDFYNIFTSNSISYPKVNINGWYTFNDTNFISSDSLIWSYKHNNSGYPNIEGNKYFIKVSATLAYVVTDESNLTFNGQPLKYSFFDYIVIEELGNDISRIYYHFTFGSPEIDSVYVLVFDGTKWVNNNYRYLLFNSTFVANDFYNFLISNGNFKFIPSNQNSTFTDLLISYVDIPSRVMHGLLDVNLMGTTFFVVIAGLITIVFIVYLFKRLL